MSQILKIFFFSTKKVFENFLLLFVIRYLLWIIPANIILIWFHWCEHHLPSRNILCYRGIGLPIYLLSHSNVSEPFSFTLCYYEALVPIVYCILMLGGPINSGYLAHCLRLFFPTSIRQVFSASYSMLFHRTFSNFLQHTAVNKHKKILIKTL